MILKVLGIEVGNQNPSKIYPKLDLNLGKPLDVDFPTVLVDFGSQDGAKLGGKIEKNRSKRDMKKELARCPATKGQGSARDAPRDARDAPGNFQTHPPGEGAGGGPGPRGTPPHTASRA